TVTRQVGTTDEGFHTVVIHLNAALFNRGHFDRDDRATLHAVNGIGEGVVAHGLDRERDTLFLNVHFGDGSLNRVALAIVLDRIFAALVPRQVGQMDHAVDVVVEANEQTEFGDVLDFA